MLVRHVRSRKAAVRMAAFLPPESAFTVDFFFMKNSAFLCDVVVVECADEYSIAKRMRKLKYFFRIIMVAAAALCCSCGNGESGARDSAAVLENGSSEESEYGGTGRQEIGANRYVDIAMGTVIQQTVYASEETAADFYVKSMALLNELEEERLSWRLETSEVWRINGTAGNEEGCGISEETAGVLRDCVELYERSDGAFDVTLGALTRLWNIDKWAAGGLDDGEADGFRLPSSADVEHALKLCGSGKIRLAAAGLGEGEPRVFLPEGMGLDLGAVGKGLAQSGLQGLLEAEEGVAGAVISLGGSILTFGDKPDGSPWKVGIVNPFDTSSNVGTLSLKGQWCVSTSGDYERYVEKDGVRYHHILDPHTGYPAVSDVRGVTILAKNGTLSDGLSTACFLLGPERGMELAEEYEVEVLFVMSDGQIVMSEGMETYFTEF